MMIMFDALERTAKHFANLLAQTGWKITRFGQSNSSLRPIEAIPV